MLDAVDFEMPAPAVRAPQVQLKPMELRIVSGPDRGKIHRLSEGASLVGRGLDCQIVLGDPAVSRKHFKIERTADEAVLVDLGGANGTNVNGGKTARHVLEPGDHIEIGTSVLEFFIEGVAARRKGGSGAMAERSGTDSARLQVPSRPKQGGPGKIIAIAAAGMLVLGGGATAAFLLLKKSAPKPPAGEEALAGTAVAGEANDKLQKLVVGAKTSIADMDFTAAEDALKTAKLIDPENTEIKELLKQVRAERDNQETLDDAKQMAKAGDFDNAMKKFEEIDEKSVLHADAQDALSGAREAYVSALLADAKKAADSSDNAGALKALDAVLKIDPKRAEAKAMRAQLASGEAPAVGDKVEPGKVEDKAAVKPGPGAVKAEPAVKVEAAVKDTAAGSKKADFAPGMTAYHAKQWSAAIQAFEAIAGGPVPKDAKAKAAGFSASVKAVQDGLTDATAPGVSARKAVAAYKVAYNADRRIDGFLGGFLAGKIAEAYVAQARDSFGKKQFADASEAAGEALNFMPEKAEAQQIIDKCNAQAAVMLQQAKSHFDKKNYGEARDLARQVAHILPASDKRAQEAQDIAKKANEANNQDDN